MDEPDPHGPPRREPVFNAPWPIVALIAALVGAHVVRLLSRTPPDPWALTHEDLADGRWSALLSYQFVHANWMHLVLNSLFSLAFGTPTARFLGASLRGALAFAGFFLTCGVISALGYALLHPHEPWALVGASGAASGLMAAAARLIDGQGWLGGLRGRSVIGMTVSWVAINVVFGTLGITPGAAGLPVAWEAHIIGYFAGLLLIGVFGRLAGSLSAHRQEH